MKIKTIVSCLALLFLSVGLCFAQTADDLVAQGRVFLGAKDIVNANARFASAVGLSPNHPTANALYAITRIVALPSTPAAQNFMNRIGLESAGRDIYHWTAQFPTDTNGIPLAPAGVSVNEGFGFFRTNVLIAVTGAQNNLSKIVSTNFLLNLSSNETAMAAVTLDYGDIQVLRSLLHGFEYFIYTMNAQNLDVQLSTLRNLYVNDQFSIERLLQDYPQLLTFATTNDFLAAETAFRNGVDQYLEASSFIWSRSPDVTRLFNLSPDDSEAEENFRLTLTDLKTSLAGAVVLSTDTNYVVYLGSQFTGNSPLRSLLPTIRDNSFGLATWPDLTFGNLISGITGFMADDFLSGFLDAIPTLGKATSTGDQVQIPLNVVKGHGYVVQASTDLVNWMDISTFIATSQLVIFTDSAMGVLQHRFYRVVDMTENMPPPSNNNFETRTIVSGSGVTVIGYNVNANAQLGEPNHYYGSGAGKSAWWSWTAPVSGEFVISTTGSGFQSIVAVYTGSTLSSLIWVDGGFGQIRFFAQAGVTYQIAVDGSYYNYPNSGAIQLTITQPPTVGFLSPFDGAVFTEHSNITITGVATDPDGSISQIVLYNNGNPIRFNNVTSASLILTNAEAGNYYIQIIATDNVGISSSSSVSFRVAPQNDHFTNAFILSGNSNTVTGTTSGASMESDEPYHAGYYGERSVWYSWTAPSSSGVTLSAQFVHSYFGIPLLAIYTGSSVSNLTSVASSAFSGFDYSSQVSFMAVVGTTYKIAVDGYYGTSAQFTLHMIPTSAPEIHFTNPLNEAFLLVGADINLNVAASDSDGTVTQVEFYRDGSFLGTDTNSPYSLVWSNAPLGSYYLTAVATDNMGVKSADTINVIVDFPPPANDDFADAIVLSGISVSASASNIGATKQQGEPNHYDYGVNSVWWSWTAPTSGTATLNVATEFYGPLLGVYTGNSLSSLTSIASDGYYNPMTLYFNVIAGTTYYIAVDSSYGYKGNINLNLVLTGPPANDNFASAAPLDVSVKVTGSNLGATKEIGEPNHYYGNGSGKTVWWTCQPAVSGNYIVSTAGSSFDPVIAVYTGPTLSSLLSTANGLGEVYFYAEAGTTYHIAIDGSFYSYPEMGNIQLVITQPPVVTVLSPANNSVFIEHDNITISATATDADGSISRIIFSVDFSSIEFTNTSAASLTLTNVEPGYYYIYVSAFDNSGISSSETIGFRVAPRNDDFTNAIALSGNFAVVSGTTAAATSETGEPLHVGEYGYASVWYSWTPSVSGGVTIFAQFTNSYGYIPLLAIYSGTSVSNLTAVASNGFSGFNYSSQVSFSAVAGQTYKIAVDDESFAGPFTLHMIPTAAPIVSFASPLDDARFFVGANINLNATANDSDGSVTNVEFYLDGSFLGSDSSSPYSLIWSNASLGNYHQLTAVAADNTGVKSSDIIYVSIEYPPPANDNFANAISLSGTSVSASGTNRGATQESGEPYHFDQGGSSVWWSWTAPANSFVTIAVSADYSWPLMGVYTGSSVSSLTSIGSRGYNNPLTFSFNATAGTKYYIAIDGYYGGSGSITFNLSAQ